MNAVKVELTTPSGFSRNIWLKYNAETQLWEGSYEVKSTDEPGEWTSNYMFLKDNAGNYGSINPNLKIKVVNPGDHSVPTLKNISLDKNEVTAGDSVKVSVNTTNDHEVNYLYLYYSTPNSSTNLTVTLKYNAETNSFEGVIPILSSYQSGEYSTKRLTLYTSDDSVDIHYPEPLKDGGFIVNNTNAGEVIKSISISKTDVGIGDTVNFTLNIADEEEGIDVIVLYYYTPGTNKSLSIDLKYNPNTDSFEGSYPIQDHLESGEYSLWRVSIYSTKDNTRSFSGTEYLEKFSKGNFNVANTSADSLIESISVDKKSATVGEKVNIKLKASDPVGIRYFLLWYTTPITEKTVYVNMYYNPETDYFEGNIPVEVISELGEYRVNRVGVYYPSGNIYGLDYTDTLVDGYFTVVSDETAPIITRVNEITDKDSVLSGEAEANTELTVQVNGLVIGTGTVGTDGKFNITIPVQSTGTLLEIRATDKSGNISDPVKVTVKDATAPSKPEVSEVNDQSTTVSGKAEAGSKVEVKIESTVVGTSIAEEDGSFSIEIPVQEAGTVLEVSATDEAGNVSEVVQVTVTDATAPNKPELKEVNDQSTTVLGKAEAGSKVEVKSEGTILGSSIAEEDGSFTIEIPVQKAGAVLEVSATDEAGNVSEVVQVTVTDATAPNKPELKEVNDQSTTVLGKAEAGSKVEVKTEGAILGSSMAKSDGSFTIEIPVQKAGTVLEVSATDEAGNVSEVVQVTVTDATAPNKPELKEVNDQSTTVLGKAEAGSKVEVKSESIVVGSSTAEEDGSFEIVIPVQKAGAVLEVSATDEAGNVSEVVQVTVKDVTAPSMSEVNEVNDQSRVVSGKAEAGSKVEVRSESTVVGSTIAKEDGSFTIEIPVQKAGAVLEVSATDEAGNVSEVVQVTVQDATAPSKPEVNEVNDQSTTVSGKAEAGSKVDVMSGDTVLGSGFADANGSFLIVISLQKEGVELTVFVSDADGNRSEAAKITVKDITAPKNPTVNEVSDQTSTLKGIAEAGAKVEVKTGNQILGSTVAAEAGDYSITIPLQKAGAELIIVSEDASGNRSDEVKIIVKDVTSPNKPVVSEVTEKSTQIAGTAEPGAMVEVKVNQNVIGTVTVDVTGEFALNIQAQPAGTVLMITVTDLAGNESEPLTVSVKHVVQNGWILKENNWFYFIDGKLVTAWKFINSKWYFFDSNGVMKTGWLKSGTKWYFLDGSGAMITGWLKSGGKWYYLAASGEMKTGWLKVGITWYYFDGSGSMRTGWIQSGGKWYYLYSSGAMASNTTIGSYKLGKDGAWIR